MVLLYRQIMIEFCLRCEKNLNKCQKNYEDKGHREPRYIVLENTRKFILQMVEGRCYNSPVTENRF